MDVVTGIVLPLVGGLLVIAVIIAANGYFVAQEFSYMAVDRSGLRARAEKGDDAAQRTLRITERTSFMLSGAQLGITVTGLLVGYVAQPLVGTAIGRILGGVGVPDALGVTIGTIGILVVATLVQMLFGELFPKNLAIAQPYPVAARLSRSTAVYMRVMGWAIRFFDASSNALLTVLRIEPVHDVEHSANVHDLQRIVTLSQDSGELPADLGLVLDRMLDFPQRHVAHALVPRSRVDVVQRDEPVAEVLARMEGGHSRYPVLDPDGDVVGVVHVAEVLRAHREGRADRAVGEVARPPTVVPTLMTLPRALEEMSGAGDQLCCVIDEWGGFVGIVTVEDLVEEVVGEITDEHDGEEEPHLVPADTDGRWTVRGDAPLRRGGAGDRGHPAARRRPDRRRHGHRGAWRPARGRRAGRRPAAARPRRARPRRRAAGAAAPAHRARAGPPRADLGAAGARRPRGTGRRRPRRARRAGRRRPGGGGLMDGWVAIPVTLAIIAASAFFVAVEFAVIASRRTRLEAEATTSRAARAALRSASEVSVLLAGSQLGITACTLALGAVSEPALEHALEPVLESLGLPAGVAYVVAFGIALAVVTFLHLVVGEMAPKSWAISHPERSAMLFAIPMRAFMALFRPMLVLLNEAANGLVRRVGVEPVDEVAVEQSPADLRQLVLHSAEAGDLDVGSSEQLASALETAELTVDDVIDDHPLVRVATDATVGDVQGLSLESGHLRILVGDEETPVGVVHVRDTLTADPGSPATPFVRDLTRVRGDLTVLDAMQQLRSAGAQIALVPSPDEAQARVVTIADLLARVMPASATAERTPSARA